MASQQLTLRMNVTADTKQAQAEFAKLQASLSMLMQQGSRGDIGNNWNAGMQKAVQSAKELQLHLNKAFNQKTGQLELDRLNMSLQSSGKNITQYSQALLQGGELGQAAFRNLSTQIMNTQAPTARLTGMVAELATTFKTALKYQISYGAINAVTNGIREAVSYAKELNGTLNDIRIVTGKSADEADRLARNAQKAAKNLSTSANDLLQAQLIYFQQGDSEAMSAMKGEITTKAARVAGVEAEQMSEYLTAVWNSYKVGSGELELFVDKLAAVGAATATSLEEISTAMTKVAATANTVGVSYDQLTATIATISSVTRTSAETVGTAMKTIYARMGDLKLGKEDEDGLELGTVSSQLKQVGVDILDAEGNLRDMGIVVEEVGEKWQGWTEAQRAAIAQAIAGKRQYTQLMALFENWDMYTETKGVSEGASGALEDQFKIWSESWEAASGRVQAATEGMYSKLINDDAMIAFTDGIAYLTTAVGTLLDGLGGIPGILMLIMSYLMKVKGVAIAEYFLEIGRNIKLAFGGQALSTTQALKNELASINISGITGLSTETLNYINRLKTLAPIQEKVDAAMQNMTATQKAEVQGLMEISNALGEVADKYNEKAAAAKESAHSDIGYKDMTNIEQKTYNRGVDAIAQNTQISDLFGRTLGQSKVATKSSSNKEIEDYNTAVKDIIKNEGSLNDVLMHSKDILGENNIAYQKLKKSVDQGKVSVEDVDDIFQQLNTRMENNSDTFERVSSELGGTAEGTRLVQDAMRQQGEAAGQAKHNNLLFGQSLEEIQKKCEQVSTKINTIGSAMMSIGMAMSMTSNVVETVKNNIKDGTTSIEDISSVLISLSMILTMTVLPAIQSIRQAIKLGESTMGGWITLVLSLITIIGTAIIKIGDWRSEEEKLNDSLKEINERINELKNSTREYESAIEELREKQKTANAAEYAELEREIKLKEKLKNLNEKSLQIEKERKKEKEKIKLDNFINLSNQGREVTDTEKMSTSYAIRQSVTNQADRALSSTFLYKQQYQVVDAIEQEFEKNPQNISPDVINSYEEKTQELEEQRVKMLTELAEYLSYAGTTEDEKKARDSIISQLEIAYSDSQGVVQEEQAKDLLTDLYTIDPEAFKNADILYETYEKHFKQFKIGKDVVEKFFKTEQIEAKNAAREAQNVTKTTENFVKSIDAVRDAQEEIKKNKGWLNNSTIEEVARSMTGLGNSVDVYRQKLYEANGNAAALNGVLAEMTKTNIENNVVMGKYADMKQEQIEAMLREAGVANAAAVAQKIYNSQMEANDIVAKANADSHWKNAVIILQEAQAAGVATNAAEALYLQQNILENTQLDLSQQIAALREYAEAAGEGSLAAMMLAEINKVSFSVSSELPPGVVGPAPATYTYNGKTYATYAEAQQAALAEARRNFGSVFDVGDITLVNPKTDKNSKEKTPQEKALEELDELKRKWDRGLVTTEEYVAKLNELYEKEYLNQMDYNDKLREIYTEDLDRSQYRWENRLITTDDYVKSVKQLLDTGLLNEQEYLENVQKIWDAYDQQYENDKSVKQFNIKERAEKGIWNPEMDKKDAKYVYDAAVQRYKDYLAEGISEDDPRMVKWRQEILDARSEMFNIMNTEHDRIKDLADAYIKYSKVFGFGDDSEIEATINKYEDEIAALDEKFTSGLSDMDYDKYMMQRKGLIADLYDYTKKEIEEAVNYEYDKWKEGMDKRKAELEGKKTIYSKNYEITNSVAEAQHELNKELQNSLTMYQYLDENTRKLLFNTEEYVALNAELEDIEAQANRLKRNYLADIEGKTEAEITKLTTQYEIQTENLMKQYEIKKAEFEIEKKRLALNNTLNERNTRMFVNGQWQWVANAKAVAEAQTELAEAEYEKSKIETEQWQQNTLNMFTETVSNLNLEAAKVEQSFKDLKDQLSGKEGLAATLEKVGTRITNAGDALVNWAETKLGVAIDKEQNNNTNKNSSLGSDGLSAWDAEFRRLQNIDYNWSDGSIRDNNGTILAETDGTVTIIKKKYATGTDNALGGISSVNEKGIEMWATKYGHMVELNPGDKIFNHDQFDFLYKFSRNPEQYLRNVNNSSAQAIDNRITIGGIEISGDNAEGEALHSILTRILGNH